MMIPPSPIAYVGGHRPHAVVAFGRIRGRPAHSYAQKTPRGTVTVYWRSDDGTENGGPPLAVGEITHPDTIYEVVIVSPLPVEFTGAFGTPVGNNVKWVHLNGTRVAFKKPSGILHLDAGLNIVAIGFPDVE